MHMVVSAFEVAAAFTLLKSSGMRFDVRESAGGSKDHSLPSTVGRHQQPPKTTL